MSYTAGEAFVEAAKFVKAGLENGTIKLTGSHTMVNSAKSHAESDVMYLTTLLTGLVDYVQKLK